MSGFIGSVQNAINQIPVAGNITSGLPQSVTTALQSASAATGVPLSIFNTGAAATDTRVRLSALDSSLLSGPILSPLAQTNGMLFPYSPSITFTQSVDYMDIPMVHSNTNYQAYTRTPSVRITCSGKFTVQNQQEGIYALAAVHFLRTASKSHFGENDPQAGLPPPILLFSGYGNYMFGQSSPTGGLRCILTSHSWSYDENIDTIPIVVGNGIPGLNLGGGSSIARLPALFTIQVDLTVVQTPQRMRQEFTFQAFASGQLMQANNGWI